MKDLYVYCDERTHFVLNQAQPKVILVGSYLGYSNFGDILQLKGAIKYHRETTHLEPVIVCALDSITNEKYIHKIRSWFDIEAVIFVDKTYYNLESLGLHLLSKTKSIEHLHVYGGGFLNEMWGDYKIKIVEKLMEMFLIKNYVITGQQLSQSFLPKLKKHLSQFPPSVMGGRDIKSTELIKEMGINGGFSFDDAFDILENWAGKLSLGKSKELTSSNVLFHINTSSYTYVQNSQEINQQVIKNLQLISSHYPESSITFLQAYEDQRFAVKDTLSSIINLEDDFPFIHYNVVDIAKMALLHNPSNKDHDQNLLYLRGEIAVSSSYHTTLLLHLLGIPCWLVSLNEYYQQKKEGLGVYGTLKEFLNNPTIPNYEDKRQARTAWLKELSNYFICSPSYEEIAVAFDTVNKNVKFKTKNNGINEIVASELAREKEKMNIWISEIEEGKIWLEKKVSETELEIQNKERVIADLKSWIKELETGKEWLETKAIELEKELQNKDKVIEDLTNWTKELEEGKRWLEDKLLEIENKDE
ncbi:polysaccharide pyruvyl transferase family protein [Aneurinibacillus aneurinilyticus]|uniref:polysaccharide pyruvyl transferase family protein n=1 Tax=Aneurinibacillus aneurinilyticus TaxID=1391 RepID=UPI002E243153|nr:polysaccharide pyruvyl transferase family protein [Aneurinibacillus aneurinilyticus]